MKKLMSMICALMLVVSLAACGGYTPEMGEAEYMAACKAVSYDQLARNPQTYEGTYVKLTGRITQVVEDGGDCILMVDVGHGWNSELVFVTYTHKAGEGRLLEGDTVTVYGKSMGTRTYTTVLNAQNTVPQVYGGYIRR